MSASAAGGAAPLLPAQPSTREGMYIGAVTGAVISGGGGHGSLPCMAGFFLCWFFFFNAPQPPAAA